MRVLACSILALLATARPERVFSEAPIERGTWVGLRVSVDEQSMPLYPSRDGARYYVEARAGSRYALELTNRTGERVGVQIAVDGLNVISGERQLPGRGRMYILDPWESTTVRGWRTSLEEVHQFTFVDEKHSYAARTGKANGKMGWIELAVYRQVAPPPPPMPVPEVSRDEAEPEARRAAPPADSPREEADGRAESKAAPAAPAGGAYPGTGWGQSLNDQVRLVDFNPEPSPVQRVTVRYEYRDTLVALGILPGDRLSQRERGEYGFAQPPR
jgi:hypothetical protein